VQAMARDFAQPKIRPIASEIDRDARFPHETVKGMGELGLMGIAIPEKWGGAGADTVAYAVALEEIAKACASHAVVMSVNNSLYCDPVYKFGTDAQRERFLKPVASGHTPGCFALTEAQAGSDARNQNTLAVRDGDGYVITGRKQFISTGREASFALVFTQTDRDKRHHGITAFVVEKGTRGFTVSKTEDKLGIRASDTAVIIFEDCRVPAEDLLGDPDVDPKQGFAGAMATFDNTRPLVAAMAVGCARASLDLTREILADSGVEVDYDRPAFNQHAAAATFLQLEADWEAAYLLTLQSAWMADNRQPNSMQASMAKAKAGRVGSDVTLRCVELAGTFGYSEVELLEKWGRDSKILDIFEGTQQIQQLIIARRLLNLTSAQLK
jgi:acyl-CoA dehydrogenase